MRSKRGGDRTLATQVFTGPVGTVENRMIFENRPVIKVIKQFHMKDFVKILFLFGVLYQSCTSNENCSNEDAVSFFNKHLRNIGNQQSGQAIDGTACISIFFLESVTDLNSSVSYGDVSYYEKQDSIDRDLSRWRSWLQENQCGLNLDSLKKAEKQVKERNPWIEFDVN